MLKFKQKSALLLVALLTIVALTALFLFHSLGADIRAEVAMTKAAVAVKMVREKFLELASPIERDLTLLAQWGRSGLVDFKDTTSLNSRLIPLLNSQPVVASLILADTDGREYFLIKQGTSWMTRHAEKHHPEMMATITHLDKEGNIQETIQAKRTFDPRTRTWFAGALQMEKADTVYWTEPYAFKTLEKLGITAAIKWRSNNGAGAIIVAAMDVLLETLRQFLSEIQATPGSQIVLIRNDGMMMTPSNTGIGSAGTNFVDSDALPDGLEKDALAMWTDLRKHQQSTLPFFSQGKRWWASFQPLQPDSAKTWIGVLIPEAALVSHMDQWWAPYALKFGIVVIVLALFSGLAVRHHSKQHLTVATGQETDEKSLEALIAAGESPTVEFKSTIRTNLKSGKKDKAIELAWLKSVTAFMNSDGGTLMVGVGDNGDILGIETDEFENADKCHLHVKNLIHEHIGSEFASFIQCRLHTMQGKTIVTLTCRKAEVPVFLKIGRNEDFFIRSGPSSTKLSMSQMVIYLEQRR